MIIGGVLGQDKAAAAGTSGGTQKTANAATIPDAYNPRGFYVSKPGMPPDQEREKAVSALGG